MSYQVLARKWRPRNFSSLIGQEHVVRALTHALGEQRLHHAYLFTGTRGVGKTTIARILAKSLNCESGITASPCGVCSACQEIDAGRFVDLLEVDAATNTKVDEMRLLLENAVYAPTRGRFKVYVIDEVHMLSNSAFNAMLKTLEEPPEHVKFILATTDPQKIPVTVLSRCLQFNLKQMPELAIAKHLANILHAEAIPFDEPSLALVARAAAGSMRDALSLLDQGIAHGAGRVEEAMIRTMLGVVGNEYTFSILDAVIARNADELTSVSAEIALRSLSFSSTLQELASLITRLQVIKLLPASVEDNDPDRHQLLALAATCSNEFLQLAYQIAIHGRQELPLAPDEYSGFVMTLLRLMAFRPESVADAIKALPVNFNSRPKTDVASTASVPRSEINSSGENTVVDHVPLAQQPSSGGNDWREIVGRLPLSGLPRELAQNCQLAALNDQLCVLHLPLSQAHLKIAGQDKLQHALSAYFQRPLQIRIDVAKSELDTPALELQREKQVLQQSAQRSIEQDTFVREAIDILDASLVDASIKPIS